MKTINKINKLEKELVQKNLLLLRENINDKSYEIKINNYLKKYVNDDNIITDDIKMMIMDNVFFTYFFIKDPLKQNFIEDFIAEEVKKNPRGL